MVWLPSLKLNWKITINDYLATYEVMHLNIFHNCDWRSNVRNLKSIITSHHLSVSLRGVMLSANIYLHLYCFILIYKFCYSIIFSLIYFFFNLILTYYRWKTFIWTINHNQFKFSFKIIIIRGKYFNNVMLLIAWQNNFFFFLLGAEPIFFSRLTVLLSM